MPTLIGLQRQLAACWAEHDAIPSRPRNDAEWNEQRQVREKISGLYGEILDKEQER